MLLKEELVEIMDRRKRKPKDAPNRDANTWESIWHLAVIMAGAYANYVSTPRILAERRRRAGDHSASQRDYDCHCICVNSKGIPRCQRRRLYCKFIDHPEAPTKEQGDAFWSGAHRYAQRRMLEQFRAQTFPEVYGALRRMDEELDAADDWRRKATGDRIRPHRTDFYSWVSREYDW